MAHRNNASIRLGLLILTTLRGAELEANNKVWQAGWQIGREGRFRSMNRRNIASRPHSPKTCGTRHLQYRRHNNKTIKPLCGI